MERKYVIICNRHKSLIGSTLLFWGKYTKDDVDRRSFGGYTADFNSCEKYTLEEIKNSGHDFPIYGKDCNYDNWMKFGDVAIEIKRLRRLGKPMLVYCL